MSKEKITKSDCMGRPIPEWKEESLLIPIDGKDLNIDGKAFLGKHKYLRALTSKNQTSGSKLFIRCKLKEGSKILNMNDRKDYLIGTSLAGDFYAEEIDEEYMYYISLGGYAGIFYPSKPGVWLCDPGLHLSFISIDKD